MKNDFVFDEVYYNDVNKFMCNIFLCCKEYKKFLPYLEKNKPQNEELFNSFRTEILKLMETNTFNIPDYDIASKYVYLVTQVWSGIMGKNIKMIESDGEKYHSFINKLNNRKMIGRLKSITEIRNQSFEDIIEELDDKDGYFYCDPPYYNCEDYYINHSFGRKEHEQLANMLKECKSKWMLSYYEFDDLKKWFPESKYLWLRKKFKKISGAQKGKETTGVGTEILILNYDV